MKKNKNDLKRDVVNSDTLHVGIELETYKKDYDQESSHDDDACSEAMCEHERERLEDMSNCDILFNHFSISRQEARQLEDYFDRVQYINDYMKDYTSECEDSDCPFNINGDSHREELKDELISLTGNNSIKVVTDGSIDCDDGADAEVCWNYYISKETINDNAKILSYLKNEYEFNTSCGLHINLNNYLDLNAEVNLDTSALDFLFNFVAPSRETSTYCNTYAISKGEKYSMLYEQGDRVEFRFFSPTFEAKKLNHYVKLAHVVYKRLCGQNAKLNKADETYFFEKMTKTNKLTKKVAIDSINKVNNLLPYNELVKQQKAA